MATNNYFGFAHSGTQYTASPGAAAAAAAYQQAQQGYAVTPTGATTPAATYTTQRAATGYDYSAGTTAYAGVNNYNVASATPTAATATSYDYSGYGRTPTQTYDASKTYYQQPAATAASYSTTDYSGWTPQATSVAQKPSPAVSTVYAYTNAQQQQQQQQQQQRSTPAVQKPQTTGLQQNTAAYSTQTYGSQPATNSYNTSTGYNSFSAQSAQVKKPPTQQTYNPQPSLSYSSNSYVTQPAAVNTSYSTYSQNKTIGTQNKQPITSMNKQITPGTGSNVGSGPGGNTSYSSSYDQALYNAALYGTNNTTGSLGTAGNQNKPQWKSYNKTGTTGGATGNTFNKFQRPKQPPKPQQIHYCEVCKISCAGPLTYKEHLEGSRHKKKELAQKAAEASKETPAAGAPSGRAALHPRGTVFRCDLCSVTCTGTDAYSAHLRGVKHQKVVKLHQKLGKPIPEPDPKATAILRAKAEAAEAAKNATGGGASADGGARVVAAPKINFVASGSLATTKTGESATPSEKSSEDIDMMDDNIQPVGQDYVDEIKGDDGKLQTFHCKLCDCKFNDPNAKDMHMKGKRHRLAYKKKVDPTLVVEIKPNYFQKKQKEHRERMRAEYSRRREEERVNFWTDKLMEHEERMYWEEIRRYEEEMEYYEWNVRRSMLGPMPPPLPLGPRPGPPNQRGMLPPPLPPSLRGPTRVETYDDRHVVTKHEAILPKKEQVADLAKCVDAVEKSLKNVSDLLVDAIMKAEAKPEVKVEKDVKDAAAAAKDGKETAAATEKKKEDNLKSLKEKEEKRVLKGVNRVSSLAKNILIQGEMSAELIVLCAEKPTLTLLKQVIAHLPEQLKLVAPTENFVVSMKQASAGFVVVRSKEDAPEVSINVVLTSPIIREELLEKVAAEQAEKAAVLAAKAAEEAKKNSQAAAAAGGTAATAPGTKPGAAATTPVATAVKPAAPIVKQEPKEKKPEPKDLLNTNRCLEALASLRHAKWFQAKAEPLQHCVMIIRLLRHMGSPWNLLNPWALELLVEKILASSSSPLSAGDGFRRIMEAVSSGLLLPTGPGLQDPCEKEPIDALGNMSAQDREDVTVAAQIALRQIAFHQIHKLLDMEQLKIKRNFGRSNSRKRRRDTSSGEKEDGANKKDKKEEEAAAKMETK